MTFNNTFTKLALAASFLFIPFSIIAEPTLEEVVVSARKVNENLQDVPIAMSVFTSSDIEDAGIQRPEDFIALTPNVVMANTVNVGDTLVTIRGLTSTRDAESNFAFVIDGVLQTNPNAFNRELLDIAQIEVLKGPQGALYGRNATSGAILITTKAPSEESESTAVVGIGVNDTTKLQFVNSGKMGDNIYTRFSISTRETDGEHTNIYSGLNNVDFFEDTTIRTRFLVDNGDSSWDFRAGISEASGGTINFNAVFALPAFQGFGTPGADQFYKDVNAHKFTYMFNVPPVKRTRNGPGLGVSDTFKKEVSKSFEVGFKGRYLDGRLELNGAFFETDVDDNQFFEFFAGPWGLLRVVTNIDQLDISGSELDFKYAVSDNLTLDGGVGFTDGEIKKNAHRPNTVGNNAPLAPEHTYNLGLQYETSFSANYDLVLRMDYMEVGETWFHTVQDDQQPSVWTALLGFPVASDMTRSVRDPYELIDFRASLIGEKLSLTLWGRNITDEEYLAEVIPAPEFGGSFIHEAPYATYGIDLKYNF